MIDTQAKAWLGDLLPRVVALAREAGHAIMAVYGEVNPSVEYKADASPLTQADLASHNIIVQGLSRLSPEWPVLSEEAAEIAFDIRKSWRYFWMVDPLDGTKEFLRRNGEFTVNIALIEGGAPILGVVYAPALDKLYFAARGEGAFRMDLGIATQVRVARLDKTTLRTVVSRSHRSHGESIERFLADAERHEFIPMGSSLKFCLVAEGSADIYPRIGPTMEWDTAAAQCILEEAGGIMTDLEGNSMKYNKPVLLNPGFLARGDPSAVRTPHATPVTPNQPIQFDKAAPSTIQTAIPTAIPTSASPTAPPPVLSE
jgi:3'(2'), 5'-bisphosphate nucleotidase